MRDSEWEKKKFRAPVISWPKGGDVLNQAITEFEGR